MAAGLSACASGLGPRPGLVAAGVAAPVVRGKATLVLAPDLADRSFTAAPSSYSGSATTLTVPLGRIVKAVGEKVLSAGFSQRATTAAAPVRGAYAVKVDVLDFGYAYDELSNLGLAVTPRVSLRLSATVTAPDGRRVLQKTYSQTGFSAGTYIVALRPAQKINESLHLALGQIFRDLLDDIAAAER